MMDFFSRLFDTSDFPPRWSCGDWSSFDGWLLILSDLAIAGAYAAIPLSIGFYALSRQRDIIFPKLYWLFAAFILFCGLTHLIDATLFWQPWYRLSGWMKFFTAVVSWATAIVLIRSLPAALALPGNARLNVDLQREVAERKRSETALRDTSTRLSLALQHSKLGDWWWDRASDIVTLSPRAAEIFGLPDVAPITWDSLRNLLHEDDRARAGQAVEQALADHTDYDIDYRVVRPSDGAIAWISARGRAEYSEKGVAWGMIGTVEDATERKQFEAEREHLLASEREARLGSEQANLMKDQFLATLSHELRTPLHAILGWAHVLKQGHPDPETLEGLEIIERNVRVQTQLVDELLDMNRIVAGKIHLDLRPVDVAALVQSEIDAVLPGALARQIDLCPRQVAPLARHVACDPARFRQIVGNLLANAVKFTPPGGRVDVSLEAGDAHFSLTVRDTGAGISAGFLPYVFDRFRQQDSSTTRRQGGLGLGLAIVSQLVTMHGGTVEAASEGEGRGSTFRVVIPDAGAQSPTLPAPAETGTADKGPDSALPSLAGLRVLIVDDQPDSLAALKLALEKQGASVHDASSAAAALREMASHRFNLLVSDIGMPGMDGLELVRKIRSLPQDQGGKVPAIALSAFAHSEDRDRALVAGFDLFVAKPVNHAEFIAVVHGSARWGSVP